MVPRVFRFVALAVCAGTLSATPVPRVTGIKIVDYGVYTADQLVLKETNAVGVRSFDTGNIRLAAQTHTAHLQMGLQFGFRYKIEGTPAGASVTLRFVTIYPLGGLHNPDVSEPIARSEFMRLTPIESDQPLYTGTVISHDWGMVPGEWTREVWYGGEMLTRQVFTLTQ